MHVLMNIHDKMWRFKVPKPCVANDKKKKGKKNRNTKNFFDFCHLFRLSQRETKAELIFLQIFHRDLNFYRWKKIEDVSKKKLCFNNKTLIKDSFDNSIETMEGIFNNYFILQRRKLIFLNL